MSELKLNIYKNQKEVEKVLKAESYDLMYGTVEDLLQIFDPDTLTNNVAIASAVCKCSGQLKPLLKDIFPDATDDDLKHVKLKELVPLFMEICKNIADDIGLLQQGN